MNPENVTNSCGSIGYNSLTRTIDVTVMPTFVHDAAMAFSVLANMKGVGEPTFEHDFPPGTDMMGERYPGGPV
ncbi:hypothetical protein MGYG_06709 [Nannizzia gypsea CBS 118893]|uniref:Uncharacterized protein n=1 Tax=Arthroderma gypseum (strain ATCC MYA-4604 / CBS 118893) TaxID=535722 RepID=E4V0Z7_ARTGP|nr:hypothetical protein MGYG_06709 [Nannizzia gypsea CBS 118893]EFR03712.1 hypothetical protein MGYG_06709 [Nannizzia gypsea CBS 118893]